MGILVVDTLDEHGEIIKNIYDTNASDTVVIGGDLELETNIDGDCCLCGCVDGDPDVKYVASSAVKDHDQLFNRDLPDQHPIEAITGLAEFIASTRLIDCGTSTTVIDI